MILDVAAEQHEESHEAIERKPQPPQACPIASEPAASARGRARDTRELWRWTPPDCPGCGRFDFEPVPVDRVAAGTNDGLPDQRDGLLPLKTGASGTSNSASSVYIREIASASPL